jgi:hypothetical protein
MIAEPAYQDTRERANVPANPNATPDDAAGPDEDTQPDANQDTAADTQGSVEWEAKYREAQKVISRQGQELGLLRRVDPEQDDETEDEEPEPEPEPTRTPASDRLERDSWALAEQIYGEDSIAAYGRAAKLLDRAATPADYVAAFEAYHQARLGDGKPAAAAVPAQGNGSPQQHIESNRPDASPPTDLDQAAEAALAKGDSRGYFYKKLQAIRGE